MKKVKIAQDGKGLWIDEDTIKNLSPETPGDKQSCFKTVKGRWIIRTKKPKRDEFLSVTEQEAAAFFEDAGFTVPAELVSLLDGLQL